MTFRTRLMLVFTVALVAAVGVVELLVASRTREAFERVETQRVRALVAQVQTEYARRKQEIVRTVDGIARSETAVSIAIAPDYGRFVDEAAAQAAAHGLDLLELVAGDGTIVSSAQWPARFGFQEDWLAEDGDWKARGAFLKREELSTGFTLALVAVSRTQAGDRTLYVAGGQKLDREFLATLVMPAGMRVLLYRNLDAQFLPAEMIDAGGQVAHAAALRPLIDQVRNTRREADRTVGSGAEAETLHALPLLGYENNLLGVLLFASSRRELVALEASLLQTGIVVAAAGIVVGIGLSWWATARVTRPVRQLAESAGRVAAGNWGVTVEVSSTDEIGQLARAFNRMTHELVAQRERLVQAERVAAWRELARRLAHELKNPLFPLQLTVENMQRARERYPDQFDEVFRESTATLLAELGKLKQIIGRFSDFAKMPAPEMQPVDFNKLVSETLKLFEPQLAQARIAARAELDPRLRPVQADQEQMTRVLRNLILNAIDAMPQGGGLTVRTTALHTAAMPAGVRLAVSDTGLGLTPEECARLFTPYYTTKTHGTGLGLAIVQSVVSDHHGRISVESEPGKGATFWIELGSD
ncbi:MAG TPA: ATP-binding protein [Candidatus Acidoferrales bacterium]|jgi:two-component system nitrogen regulation sensor histidine kinase NtrY|nr:ATP-binding protein [Candidatus Acidoferrales bacterium]